MGFLLDTVHLSHFQQQSGHGDPLERISVLEALEARGDRKMLIGQAALLLKDADADVRMRAGEILASAGGAEAAVAAAELLASEVPFIRDAAIGALAGMGKTAVPPTVKRLEHPQSYVKIAALRVLAMIPARSVLDSVAGLLGNPDIEVVIAAIRTLGQHHATDYLPDLRVVYRRVPASRLTVIEVLRLIGAHEGIDLLETALKQDDPVIRRAAVEAIRSIDSPKARRLLSDNSQMVG
ncbi:MAG: HEAT repeat domain-containing protein [Rhodothermales bacterium]